MLKAKALLFAILVALLIAIVSSSLILLAQMRRTQQDKSHLQTRLLHNVSSGMEVLKSKMPIPEGGVAMDLFANGSDSVFLERKQWGLFKLARATAFSAAFKQKNEETQIALLGVAPRQRDLALYLADNNRLLGLCGKTEIRGTAFLPKAGVKRAYINGESYTGTRLIYGTEKRSNRLPKLQKDALLLLKELGRLPGVDQTTPSTKHSFMEQTLHLHAESMNLDGYELRGNILISADSLIYVGASTQLEDVLLMAPQIVFESGFEGSLQAFATDSLVLQEDVELNYPSVLCLYDAEESSALLINKKCQIKGLVLLVEAENSPKQGLVSIEKEVVIDGELFAEGKVQLKGSVLGALHCEAFYLKTPSSIYENHLLEAKISPSERNKYYLGPGIYEEGRGVQIVKYLR